MNFDVYSSKSYLDVEKVVINKEEYEVNKLYEENTEKYEVNLQASHKAGTTTLKLQKVIMSDGSIVDIDKKVNVEVLKEDAYLTDVVVEDRSDTEEKIKVAFKLMDVDDTIKNPKIQIYNEENELVAEKEINKSNILSYTKISSTMNVNKSGTYTVKVIATKNNLDDAYVASSDSKVVELLCKEISINMEKTEVDNKDEALEQSNTTEDLLVEEGQVYALKARSVRSSDSNIIGSDAVEHEHNIYITGNIADENGQIKPGTLQVKVPTSAAFNVDKDGNFSTADITITNQGTQSIDIYAYKFIDVNGTEGIDIKSETDVIANSSNIRRSNISLNIFGSQGTAYFKTEKTNSDNTGVYKDKDLTTQSEDGIKISTISPNSNDKLRLQGEVGKQTSGIDTAIRDTFTLILKIKKSTN